MPSQSTSVLSIYIVYYTSPNKSGLNNSLISGLILLQIGTRSAEEETTPAVEYKTKERLKLEEQGYRIWSGFGDQWSDITGAASGSRTFKLPNPMYYI